MQLARAIRVSNLWGQSVEAMLGKQGHWKNHGGQLVEVIRVLILGGEPISRSLGVVFLFSSWAVSLSAAAV